ncbi:MAG: T9SS type B sorting domain-containing protein [Paludibacteraceae bacterium]|nr:T9SS type B sorting domain-containing protein [Paludibacteraceae bacterium]MBN2787014.1 T9SS type B sorting domain-containing protein [Paludibacteraceae bacterium]
MKRKIKNTGMLGARKAFIFFLLATLGLSLSAQMTERPTLAKKGKYDVRMISGQALQAAWMKSASPFVLSRPMTNDEMHNDLYYCGINNYVSEAGANGVATRTDAAWLAMKPADATGMAMIYCDIDDDMSTFQSSAAYLDFGADMACTTVEAAYLYWVGNNDAVTSNYATYPGTSTLRSHAGGATGGLGGTAYKTVKFKPAGVATYTDVTANRDNLGLDGRYICFADVTSLVKGKPGGLYTVGNVRSSSAKGDGGAVAGWTLVVMFTPPNCPQRTIKFWDGILSISSGGSKDIILNFDINEVPASGNSKSYLGIAVTDGENLGAYLYNDGKTPEFLEFRSFPGGATFRINPFAPGQTLPNAGEPQPPVAVYSKDGAFLADAYEGFSCSRISTWSDELGTNGNELIRLPSQTNTLGYDAHHLKLPTGAMVAGATSATMTYYAGPQGGTSPFMAYMAIQTLQPNLQFTMTAAEASTSPGSELTYNFKLENIGELQASAGSIITDTLDIAVQYVEGSLSATGGTVTHTLSNLPDGRQLLTITVLGTIDIGASVDISFKVRLKDLTHTEIWAYGCNRQVRNKAIVEYKDSDNNLLTGQSNSLAGCGAGSYFTVPVSSTELETQYETTHFVEATLTDQVAAGTVYIAPTVRNYLQQQLTILKLPTSDVSKYVIFDEDGNIVQESAYFTQDEPVQNYSAEADLGDGCIETYYFEFSVAKVPTITSITPYPTSQSGANDGTVMVRVEKGEPSYSCKIVDANDENIVYFSGFSNTATEYDFLADGLIAGSYKAIVGDRGSKTITSNTFVIAEAPELTVSISGSEQVCEGNSLNLTAVPSGRPEHGLEYVWYDNFSSEPIGIEKTITVTPEEPTIYRVYACDRGVQATAEKQVTTLPTPQVKVLASDSGCHEFNLAELYVTEESGLSTSDYVLTLHTAMPSSATDNRFLIPTSRYIIKQKMTVWARMAINDLCYTTAKGQVYVKSMEECYPITISKFFSPDADGFNDRWQVEGIEEYNNPEILIYDRYGKIVFKGGKEDLLPPRGWDGSYLGNPLPSADYWYQMNFNEIKPKVGHFTLKRKKE